MLGSITTEAGSLVSGPLEGEEQDQIAVVPTKSIAAAARPLPAGLTG